ncbi:IS1182 family transposase [Methylobacterium haplocladii]|uniref:IS1182 family transposase n=1 Tax=Methylobacterium haplocladii TaxID=1176176 RepID=A0A512IW04_9HYPH|nr:IS1182 family transposase [Methylobacterium haplocladii]GEP01910.1 IS1182 family transposase [Methylobacterium haplocladii]GJD86446.1 IS1182 family transposase ISPpu20 [Methylobacterium haplocladii]GLS61554.1 IS1182 family transposase [Methylobacterium haplocladii]
MGYIVGEDRAQASLLPARVEGFVAAEAAVRVIDAFVDGLDLAGLGFGRAVPATTGRPGYDPRDLLKLYVWGYFNEVRSSRRLERACRRDVEAMWLLRRLAPDFKTIADFRRDNGPAIVGAARAFVLLCRDAGLFAARLVALDGSKFRAAASPKKVIGRDGIAEEAARLDRKIASYLAGLDEADAREPDDEPGAVPAALAALRTRRAELDRLAARMDAEGRATLVEDEADARPMGHGAGPKPPSYNVQSVVDVETGLIVHHAVTDEPTDRRQLHPMASATKAALDLAALTVVADKGYGNGAHAGACERDAILACVPPHRAVNNQGDGTLFDRTAFAYQPETDTLVCPAGRSLIRKQLHRKKRNVTYVAVDCSGCALKDRCTTAERRFVERHLDDDTLNRMAARATPEMMRARRCAVEHPFGTIKRMMAGGRFLTRNLKGTRTEIALSVLAYNLLRTINLRNAPA